MIAIVVYLSVTPSPPDPFVRVSDKIEHTAAYLALMFWFGSIYRDGRSHHVLAASFISMGVILEFIQRLTGFRRFELLDVTANIAGVFIGWLMLRASSKKRHNN